MYAKLTHLIFIAASLLLSGCGGGGSSSKTSVDNNTSRSAKWTYMVYIAGDNNLATAAINDINEMETVGSTDDVNVIVQVEYSPIYTPNMPTSTLRGKITKDYNTKFIGSQFSSIGERDMGSKTELTDFIKWATTNYPADHYALVLWDHGAGWKTLRQTRGVTRGAIEDQSAGSFMSLPDLAAAVRDSGATIDIVNFDACLMAMYEVAYEFKGLAKYMTFSEETEPGAGDPYDTILKALTATPTMSALDLAKLIPQKFKEFYQVSDRTPVTKSSIDLTYIEQLHGQITDLSDLFVQNIGLERSYIQIARRNAVTYEYPTNIDLGDFVTRVAAQTNNANIKNKIQEINQTLDSLVISNQTYSPTANDPKLQSTGLAIFVPERSEITADDLTQYAQLAINTPDNRASTTWGDLVNALITGDSADGQVLLETTAGNFAIWLEWDTDSDLDLIIWEPNGEFAAPYIGTTSTNGFLSDDSINSGLSVEYYAAAEVIQKGTYDIFVNYYSNGTSDYANATLYFLDPENGITDWIKLDSRMMSLSTPAPEDWLTDEQSRIEVWNDVYSDWWWWYNNTYFNRSTSSRLVTETVLSKGDNIIRIHTRQLPEKNHFKNPLHINDETSTFVHDQLMSTRPNMDKTEDDK